MHADCGLFAGCPRSCRRQTTAGTTRRRAHRRRLPSRSRAAAASWPSPWRHRARRPANSAKRSSHIRRAPRFRRRSARRCPARCCLRPTSTPPAAEREGHRLAQFRLVAGDETAWIARRQRRIGRHRWRQDRFGRQRWSRWLRRPPAIFPRQVVQVERQHADRADQQAAKRPADHLAVIEAGNVADHRVARSRLVAGKGVGDGAWWFRCSSWVEPLAIAERQRRDVLGRLRSASGTADFSSGASGWWCSEGFGASLRLLRPRRLASSARAGPASAACRRR